MRFESTYVGVEILVSAPVFFSAGSFVALPPFTLEGL